MRHQALLALILSGILSKVSIRFPYLENINNYNKVDRGQRMENYVQSESVSLQATLTEVDAGVKLSKRLLSDPYDPRYDLLMILYITFPCHIELSGTSTTSSIPVTTTIGEIPSKTPCHGLVYNLLYMKVLFLST